MRPQQSSVTSIRRSPRKVHSPISLLPAEVLSNIFLCTRQPLVLTHVCSSWRKIAIHTPQLWTELDINYFVRSPLPSSSPFARPVTPTCPASLAKLWFDRAKRLPLSVSIRLTGADHDISTALQPVLANAHVISHLSIHTSSHHQLARFLATQDVEFTRLESLSLSGSGPINVFEKSPRLTTVNMEAIADVRLPWGQLKTLSITEAIPTDSFHSLLSSCTNLTQGSFSVEDAKDDTYASDDLQQHVTLPNFTELNLSFYGRHQKSASSLLTPFHFPNLRHFNFFSGFITLPFMPTINSASNSLQSLSLSGISISSIDFRSFAFNTPFLRSLSIDLRYFTEDITNILGILSSNRCFPNLQNLDLWTFDVYPYKLDYARMIKVRGRITTTIPLRLSLYLARQQHNPSSFPPSYTSYGVQKSTSQNGNGLGLKRIDSILEVVDVAEKTDGLILYITDIRSDQGIL